MNQSASLINEEGVFGGLEREVAEPVGFVHRVAAEALAEEHVPVGFPVLIEMGLDGLRNLEGG